MVCNAVYIVSFNTHVCMLTWWFWSLHRLVAGRADGLIEVWDADARNLGLVELNKFTAHRFAAVTSLTFSSDGSILASGSQECDIKLWSPVIEARKITRWEGRDTVGAGHGMAITSLDFSPDNSRLVSCSLDKKLVIWDVEAGSEMFAMPGHADHVYAAVFTPDGQRVVSGSYDKSVKLWDIAGADISKTKIKRSTERIGMSFGGPMRAI